MVEVCGFNDWLLQALEDHQCHKVILIQPEERKRQKSIDAMPPVEVLQIDREEVVVWSYVSGLVNSFE